MAYIITRLCRDCVDGACMEFCPTECILEHRPADASSHLPRQLFIDPQECISCNLCAPECPWDAIYEEGDVPAEFHADIALNALAQDRSAGFHVPTERLLRGASEPEITANKQRWGLGPDGSSLDAAQLPSRRLPILT